MKKKTIVWWILGVVAAILILIPIGYASLLKSMHKATTGYQISTKVLSQLSSIQELKGSVITPMGERYTNDSTICSYRIVGHWFWSIAFPSFLRSKLAGVPVCSYNHYDSDGRRMRHYLRSSQSRFLVGCPASLHNQYTIFDFDRFFLVSIRS